MPKDDLFSQSDGLRRHSAELIAESRRIRAKARRLLEEMRKGKSEDQPEGQ